MGAYRPSEIEQFGELSLSLQKWRRAEIIDEHNRNVAPLLYEDPLADDQLLKQFIRPNTTVLVGRKGTGKSTLIQKAEEVISGDSKIASIYLDVKTLHTSVTAVENVPYTTKSERDYAKRVVWFQAFLSEFAASLAVAISERDGARTIFGPKSISPAIKHAIAHLSVRRRNGIFLLKAG